MKTGWIFPVLAVLLLNCCTSKEHLTFNYVPIDGKLSQFARELAKTGYSINDSTKKNEILLHGQFLNKDCKVMVLGTSKSDLAYKVIVSLPEEVHDSLQPDFEKLQKLYSLQYGMGYSKYQQYKKRERLVYKVPERIVMAGDYTKYTTDSGEIMIEVQKGYISITYWDKLNFQVYNKE